VIGMKTVTRRPVLAVALLTFTVACLLVAGAAAEVLPYVDFEGEDYVASHNIGGAMIQVGPCGGASGGSLVKYIDVPGEWIELEIDLPEDVCYDSSVRFQGYVDFVSDFIMTLLGAGPGGEDLVSEFSFVGAGHG